MRGELKTVHSEPFSVEEFYPCNFNGSKVDQAYQVRFMDGNYVMVGHISLGTNWMSFTGDKHDAVVESNNVIAMGRWP